MVSSVKVWTVKSGDNLPAISAAVYGDPRLWRLIADANDISNPLKFPDRVTDLGRVLMIPERRQ
jgi:nucleoid-associated protein YgaU